jgi:hypothetical protein
MQIAHALQSIGFLTDFRESAIVYPIVMATHLTCIAIFGGAILVTDLRLLGVLFKTTPVSEVVNGLRWWKRIGMIIMVTAGFFLGSSEAEKYTPNPFFWTKMILLILVIVHAIIFKPKIYDHPEALDKLPQPTSTMKAAGAISLVLWLSIVTFGRLIGYWEPKKEGPNASYTPPAIMQTAQAQTQTGAK